MGIGDKIKSARIAKRMTQEELGNALGVQASAIAKYEKGRVQNIKRSTLKKLSDILDIPPIELVYDKVPDTIANKTTMDNIFPIEVQKIPLLGEIACGEPIFASEDRESYVEASTKIHADFCLKCKGDSMTGARIQDGDIVFIRQQPTVENGEIAAVIIGEEATLKRVYYLPEKDMFILKAENPKFQDLFYFGEQLNEIRILGKAVAFQGDVI